MKKLFIFCFILLSLSSCYSVVVKDNDKAYHFYNMLKDKPTKEILNFVKAQSKNGKKDILSSIHNPYGLSSIALCIITGREELIPDLIDLGANVDAQGLNGATALHLAAQLNKPTIVTDLLEKYKAQFLTDKTGKTPFHYAAAIADNQTLFILVNSFKEHVNDKDNLGNTALLEAVKINNIANIKVLLSAGASPAIKNDAGDSAASYVTQMNYDNIDTLFSKSGGSSKKGGRKKK